MCISNSHQVCPRCGRSELTVNHVCDKNETNTKCNHCGFGECRPADSKGQHRNIAAGVMAYALTAYPESTVRIFIPSACGFSAAMHQLRRDLQNRRIVRETARLTCWNENLKQVEVLFGPEVGEGQPAY
jgi:ribosomal protein L37E